MKRQGGITWRFRHAGVAVQPPVLPVILRYGPDFPGCYALPMTFPSTDTPVLPESERETDRATRGETDRVFTATDSPCVAVCSTLFDDICRGCGRTATEVSNWVFLSPEEKKKVWVRIRAEGYPRRNG